MLERDRRRLLEVDRKAIMLEITTIYNGGIRKSISSQNTSTHEADRLKQHKTTPIATLVR